MLFADDRVKPTHAEALENFIVAKCSNAGPVDPNLVIRVRKRLDRMTFRQIDDEYNRRIGTELMRQTSCSGHVVATVDYEYDCVEENNEQGKPNGNPNSQCCQQRGC